MVIFRHFVPKTVLPWLTPFSACSPRRTRLAANFFLPFPCAKVTTSPREALRWTACLVILDNLEILDGSTLTELLDAAKDWSEAGGARVLLTSRRPEFPHAAYRTHGTHRHRNIPLAGLGRREYPDDALDWFAVLWRLPPAPLMPRPAREGLIELFQQVAFHPLSLRVLAAQLKTRRIAELGERLGELLKTLTPTPLPLAGEQLCLRSSVLNACPRFILFHHGVEDSE
jgi:hypothetical protein